MGRTIAIDGPSGAGKSTIAKMLAELLGFKYLDTGAMYRAVAIGFIRAGIKPDDADDNLYNALKKMSISFAEGSIFLNGEDVSLDIRTTESGHYASIFSARKPVREFLLPVQKMFQENNDIVAEGRDMTTVVFPDAWKKFYLDAGIESRAKRRHVQLNHGGIYVDMKQAMDDVVERDKRDSSRELAPLRVAEDAVYIDTTDMSIEEVIKKIMEEVKKG